MHKLTANYQCRNISIT